MKKVKLNLSKLTISKKVTLGGAVSGKMNGNPFFPTPSPAITDLNDATKDLKIAAENSVKGTQEQTEIMYAKETAFDIVITGIAGYVTLTANQDTDNSSTIINSAGLEEAKKGVYDVPPIRAKKGPLPLSAFVYAKAGKGKVGYRFQMAMDADTLIFSDCGNSQIRKLLVMGLTFGKKYLFRVAITKGAVTGDFSDPCSLLIGM